MKGEKILKLVGAGVTLGAFGLLWWLEKRRPLRRRVERKLEHTARNLTVAGLSAVALQIFERPVIEPLTELVERRRLGLLKLFRLPRFLEIALAIVLLDYTLYLWHVLTHRLSFLWRFHAVHHVDLDLDASTAVRFHFGEMIISVAWRAGQVLAIGVSPVSFAAWQLFLFPSILFHHANVELPVELEKRLRQLIVTPRMHGIHHSIVRQETDSNWSSGLTVWDRLHGTLRTDVPQDEIIIGIPAYREPEEVDLTRILAMPFAEQRPSWDLPEKTSAALPPQTNQNRDW